VKPYKEIEQNDWTPDPAVDYYKHNDSAKAIGQIRHRLATMGDLKRDSGSNLYDEELMEGVMSFKKKWIQNQQNTFDLAGATNEHTD
jgi:hypothetical protein